MRWNCKGGYEENVTIKSGESPVFFLKLNKYIIFTL